MKVPENEQDINLSNHQLLQSLLDSIPKTHSFKGKWSLIGTKLSDLKTQLSDLFDFPANSLSQELFVSLSKTLSDALSLCNACHSPNLPGGKLKTQNDLDSISAKLDNLIRDCDVLIKSGVLHDAVVSTSTTASKRETVRVESRDLITRLQVGTTESKNSVLDSLLGIVFDFEVDRRESNCDSTKSEASTGNGANEKRGWKKHGAGGFSILFVLLAGLLGVLVGYFIRRT